MAIANAWRLPPLFNLLSYHCLLRNSNQLFGFACYFFHRNILV